MQTASEDLARSLLTGAKTAARAEIFLGTQLKEDTYYGGDNLLLVSDSSRVSYDRLSDTRTTGELRFFVRNIAAQDLIDPLFYPEVALHAGVEVGGVMEWVDLGIMGLYDVTFERTGHGVFANCQVGDRSTRIRDNSWKQPYQVVAGLDYYVAIKSLITERARGFVPEFNLGTSTLLTPSMIFSEDDDPWAAVLKLAEAIGAEAYFDRQGAVSVFPVPDPQLVPPSIVLNADPQGILITPVTRQYGNRDVFNGVICKGEAPWLLFPVMGEVWDDDPGSPSYRGGPFGEKPKKIGDALATTNAQCLAAAQAEYLKVAGVIEVINFNNIKDPRIEVSDVIEQRDVDLNILGRYVLDTYNYPLGAGPASGTVRRKR